jgi:hypothetical protein
MNEDALPSVFLKASTPSYMPEESYFTSPEETSSEDAYLLNEGFEENENNVPETEKWKFVRPFFNSIHNGINLLILFYMNRLTRG